MPPANNTRSRSKAIARIKWQCDFCAVRCNTFEEALEHERDCDARAATISLSYETGKKLGLQLADESVQDEGKDEANTYVTISEKSPILALLPVQAVANDLFSMKAVDWEDSVEEDSVEEDSVEVDGGVNSGEGQNNEQQEDENAEQQGDENNEQQDDDEGSESSEDSDPDRESESEEEDGRPDLDLVDDLIDFGKKNMDVVTNIVIDSLKYKYGSRNFDNTNHGAMRALFTGRLRAGDFVKEVRYTTGNKKETLFLENGKCGSHKLAQLLRTETNYPVEITLQHRLCTQQSKVKCDNPYTKRKQTRMIPLCEIETLDLTENELVDEEYSTDLAKGLSKMHLLRKLTLDRNSLGRIGTKVLANLVKKKGSSLRLLSLQENAIDDDCISIFAEALRNNTTLETLNLDGNDEISSNGWSCMLNLICDKTSINRTYLSNHTLKYLGDDVLESSRSSMASSELKNVCIQLRDMLDFNALRACYALTPSRTKVWRCHFQLNQNDKPFNLQPLLPLDVKIMPQLLAWFTNSHHPKQKVRMRNLYHLIRNWNLPVLFCFPSAESLRIGSRVADLELLVERLKAENRVVVDHNRALREEIRDLKGETDVVDSAPIRRSKRKRRS